MIDAVPMYEPRYYERSAVRELTARQAELHGLHDHGLIAPRAAGDLTVFDLAELSWEPDVLVDDLPQGATRLRRSPERYRADRGRRHRCTAGRPTHRPEGRRCVDSKALRR